MAHMELALTSTTIKALQEDLGTLRSDLNYLHILTPVPNSNLYKLSPKSVGSHIFFGTTSPSSFKTTFIEKYTSK